MASEIQDRLDAMCLAVRIQAAGGVNTHVKRQAERYRLSHLFEGIDWNRFEGQRFIEFGTQEDSDRWHLAAMELWKAEQAAGDLVRVVLRKPVGKHVPGDELELPYSQAHLLIERSMARRAVETKAVPIGRAHGSLEFHDATQSPHGHIGKHV